MIGQAAAEKLGVPVENVSVHIGDSDLPPAPVAGGSNSAASTCSAVIMVCDQIRQRLFKALMPNESMADKAEESVGVGQTPVTDAAKSGRPLDREKAFDARVFLELGELPLGARGCRSRRVKCRRWLRHGIVHLHAKRGFARGLERCIPHQSPGGRSRRNSDMGRRRPHPILLDGGSDGGTGLSDIKQQTQ